MKTKILKNTGVLIVIMSLQLLVVAGFWAIKKKEVFKYTDVLFDRSVSVSDLVRFREVITARVDRAAKDYLKSEIDHRIHWRIEEYLEKNLNTIVLKELNEYQLKGAK